MSQQFQDPILFLPGLLNDGRLFAAQIANLQERATCRAITLDFASDISALAAGVLEQAPASFSLVALSMGGYTAFEVIRQLHAKGEESRLKRLALLNTSARSDSEEQREHRQALIALSQQGRFKGVTPRLLPQLLGWDALQNPAITELIGEMAETVGQEGFVRQQQAIISRPDSREILGRIEAPALVIAGSQDRLTPPTVMREIANGIPQADFHELEGCGHLSPLEKADAVTDLLTAFFAS